MTYPTLSVILPNFNHAQYLPSALKAMVEQTVKPHEIVVIDDGSTDNSVEIIKDFAAKYPFVHLYPNEKNQGVVPSVERALGIATGDYLYFAAGDDEVLPGIFEKSLTLLAKHPEAALSCGVADLFEVDSGLNWHVGVATSDSPCYLAPCQLVELEKRGRLFISASAVIVRRDCLMDEIGGFYRDLKCHTDWFSLYVAAFRHGMCYVPDPVVRFNIHSQSYYKKARADKAVYRSVLENVMKRLTNPPFEKEGELIRQAGSLYQFAGP